MTRDEFLRRVAKLNEDWSKRYADRIEMEPAVSDPHNPGGYSDLPEHHHAVSAPSAYADILDERLDALIQEYQASGGR